MGQRVCAFDLEWVPDAPSGRRVYRLPATMPDAEVFRVMWEHGGATAEKPRPYLKTALCRVVSVAAVIREQQPNGDVSLRLTALPKQADQPMAEGELISTFLSYVGRHKPQLVGFNSQTSDVPILLQRGMAMGISAKDFCYRPDKPWEGTDYFSRHTEAHIDIKNAVSGWGIGTPSLHELAAVMGIPGKLGTDGSTVIDLWVEGNLQAIVEYNHFDALTTYLVWLRMALFAGFLNADQHHAEENRVRELLHQQIEAGKAHLAMYLEQWNSFQPADTATVDRPPMTAVLGTPTELAA